MTIAELRALLAKATPGPWQSSGRRIIGDGERVIAVVDQGNRQVNGELLTAAVRSLPALLDVAALLVKVRDEYRTEMSPEDNARIDAALAKLES